MARVTFLGHSGFSVKTDEHLLIFDCTGGRPAPGPADRAIAFVSHSHRDHFWPEVAAWRDRGLCQLVVGDDLPESVGGTRLSPGDEAMVDGAAVRAFGSTDQGVSFLVQSGGRAIFHAGDLNFWHWRAESTADEVDQALRAFEAVLESIRGRRVDAAFFPVDPRLGEGFSEGALRFAEVIRTSAIIPMHFWGHAGAALAFAEGKMPAGVRAIALTSAGQSIDL